MMNPNPASSPPPSQDDAAKPAGNPSPAAPKDEGAAAPVTSTALSPDELRWGKGLHMRLREAESLQAAKEGHGEYVGRYKAASGPLRALFDRLHAIHADRLSGKLDAAEADVRAENAIDGAGHDDLFEGAA